MLYKVFQGSNKVINLLKSCLLKELNEVLRIDVLHLDDSGIRILLEFINLRHADMLILIFGRSLLLLGLESKTFEVLGVGCGFIYIDSAILADHVYLTARMAFYFYFHNNSLNDYIHFPNHSGVTRIYLAPLAMAAPRPISESSKISVSSGLTPRVSIALL